MAANLRRSTLHRQDFQHGRALAQGGSVAKTGGRTAMVPRTGNQNALQLAVNGPRIDFLDLGGRVVAPHPIKTCYRAKVMGFCSPLLHW